MPIDISSHIYKTKLPYNNNKLVQGSRLLRGIKAPLWVHNNDLKNTLERKLQIDSANKLILEMPDQFSSVLSVCNACKKSISEAEKCYYCSTCSLTYHKKCTTDRSNRSRQQPIAWRCFTVFPFNLPHEKDLLKNMRTLVLQPKPS